MKLARDLGTLLLLSLLAGCANTGPPLPPSLELPKSVSDLRATRKGNRVMLSWTVPSRTTDNQTVRRWGPTRICRSLEPPITDCANTAIGEAAPPPELVKPRNSKAPVSKEEGSYTDALSPEVLQKDPTGVIAYAVSVMNTDRHSAGPSNQVQVPAAPTLPPPGDFKAQVTADGVVLMGATPPALAIPGLHYFYRVYRQPQGKPGVVAVEAPLTADPAFQIVDHGFEWESTYDYRVSVVTVVSPGNKPDMQVEGEDTPAVTVVARDIFPPSVPGGLQAVFAGVGQKPVVDLVWAPGTEQDLAGYNLYRHEEGAAPVKINATPIAAPAYHDGDVASGHTYFYSVTAVDLRGNESAPSEEANERVP